MDEIQATDTAEILSKVKQPQPLDAEEITEEEVSDYFADEETESDWKKIMREALEDELKQKGKEGKYFKFKGLFGRNILILAGDHQKKTESKLLRRVSTLPTSSPRQQEAAAEEKR